MYQNKSQVYLVLGEFILLFFCFWFFEPLLSFFIYFCFLHSTRHLLDEKNNLDLKFGELHSKNRKTYITKSTGLCIVSKLLQKPSKMLVLNARELV